jgi:hypothetical protein
MILTGLLAYYLRKKVHLNILQGTGTKKSSRIESNANVASQIESVLKVMAHCFTAFSLNFVLKSTGAPFEYSPIFCIFSIIH